MRIRAMASVDVPRVLCINASGRPGVAPLDPAEMGRLLKLPNRHLVAAASDDSVQGYALALDREAPYEGEEFLALRSAIAEPFIYIDQVAVAPGHEGRGLGRALYQELERIAGRHRIRVLCCEVNTKPPNPGSMAFHTRMGFEAFASLAVSDGREVRLLTRMLPGDAGA